MQKDERVRVWRLSGAARRGSCVGPMASQTLRQVPQFCGIPSNDGTQGDSPRKMGIHKCVFLRNEPTVLARFFRCKCLYTEQLRRKVPREIGGFVLENEPTGRGVLRL